MEEPDNKPGCPDAVHNICKAVIYYDQVRFPVCRPYL
jgi:hypothetical protein